VRFVAPEMFEQFPPFASQRCHWYPNEIGCVPPQTPGFAVSVSPSRRFPAIDGIDVLLGAAARAPMTPVLVCAVVDPSALRAVTTTTSRLLWSVLPSR
jgi:hypothetical protein